METSPWICNYCKLREVKRGVLFNGGLIRISRTPSSLRVEKVGPPYTSTTYLTLPEFPTECRCGRNMGKIKKINDARAIFHFAKRPS